MDYMLLVDEILSRVMKKLSEQDVSNNLPTNKNKVLILTEQHQTICHELLENSKLQTCCEIECAFLKDYNCEMDDYDMVVIYHLTNHALCKLAGGICDSPFLSLASKAILLGEKILIPKSGIELYQYEKTAPKAYYAMMIEKLKLLEACGVIICDEREMELILTSCCPSHICQERINLQDLEAQPDKSKDDVKLMDALNSNIILIDKKVITESDIKKSIYDGTSCIHISSKAILSDLAKEYLHNRKIKIQRVASTCGK